MHTLDEAVSRFGEQARAKLRNVAAYGQPEEQLRGPIETLLGDIAGLCGFAKGTVVAVGETSLADLKTRPDYAVSVNNGLAGFIEIKAPGKGADPRKFRDVHDREQWGRLKSLPNLIYADGNQFSLWHNGDLIGSIVQLHGDIETAGDQLAAPAALQQVFAEFLGWEPTAPRTARQLAEMTARLCRLLRDEVTEQLAENSPSLTALAQDWRQLLFPEASNEQFADGYAQAVTFGLLVARARHIELKDGLDRAAKQLGTTNSLIGAALRLLTDDAAGQLALKTSLGTLVRVLDAVEWQKISRGDPDAWLYFYEHFLETYDNSLRKKTGSYYTPPEVVRTMVRLVDEALKSQRYAVPAGLASPSVTLADPAVGTGTFVLGALRQIAESVEADQGAGAVPAAIEAAIGRIMAFELQLGPFAVAQLRIVAELTELIGTPPRGQLRMFVADTLSNPYVEEEKIPGFAEQVADSRKAANRIKRDAPITVVIGNPPYKDKAKGKGGWVEAGGRNSPRSPPLNDWMPPPEWGVGAHSRHLYNLYVYFWRWATWKVFDHHANSNTGMVCFITAAGFLAGPGFQKMRDYLRRKTDEIWVIDCSPDGHQPEINTRIFEGVQQPVCIVLASRPTAVDEAVPAVTRYQSLPLGRRAEKLTALNKLTLGGSGWTECPRDWRAPFVPQSQGAWSSFPRLAQLFDYDGTGVMAGRTWVFAPDPATLLRRWQTLVQAPKEQKEALFFPHIRNQKLGDKHVSKLVTKALPGFPLRAVSVADDSGECVTPVRYGFRSLDRQWAIPDSRLLNQSNPELWASRSEQQVYLTAQEDRAPVSGPAVTFTAHVPDVHHYAGRGGRVFPLWRNPEATSGNVRAQLLDFLGTRFKRVVSPSDFMAYIAAVTATPAFTTRFQSDMSTPGLRLPITANAELFARVVAIGRKVIWLQTFGERFADAANDRPNKSPRLPSSPPHIPMGGGISYDATKFPDSIGYDAVAQRLTVGDGYIDGVTPQMWSYEVSGKQVLLQWFSNRRANRTKPVIGEKRAPSRLGELRPDSWPAEYTTELIDLLHVLGSLVQLEPTQAEALEQVCSGPTFSENELLAAHALVVEASDLRQGDTPMEQVRLI